MKRIVQLALHVLRYNPLMAQRILVVDDDRQITRLVQSYLQQAGFTALTAYDGEEALHAIRREKPDLVVAGQDRDHEERDQHERRRQDEGEPASLRVA